MKNHVKLFEDFITEKSSDEEDVYVTTENGKKKRIYVEKQSDGKYAIGCNGTSLHKTGIDKKDLDDEIEKMKKEVKKEKF